MKYRDYSAEDLANDSFFIRWVKSPDAESDWFWESFMKEHPARQPEIEKARELISLLEFPIHTLEGEEMTSMRNGLLMSLHAEKEENKDKMASRALRVSRTGNRRLMMIAASILIIPSLSFGLYWYMNNRENTLSFRQGNEQTDVEQRSNPVGQKSVLILSDDTKVWLNAASKISYAKDFRGEDTRDVYLEGEAFFDVAHNARKPFIVHTSSLKIRVLGTSFNVKSYPEEKTIETTLVQGKVRIEQPDKQAGVELKPNQRAVFDKESKIISVRDVVAANSGFWKEERLVFDEESIDNVILQMERWYNVRIHVENRGNLDCKLTASIENESLRDVLKLLEASHNIRYIISGQDVFIEGSLCESAIRP